eukprot:TRINITY_DN92318_c0_g1_i1.p1 TRINITY_DN92318_c0_g1~~TRINITY_DN92318_c0_g1_i1.p1  ORF type:complete len:389 (-),score=59.30 TRINITY_DN92318_c0_g1_i1:177-1238(-)
MVLSDLIPSVVLPSPAKRRRLRAAALRSTLWQRTRWGQLSDDEEVEQELRRSLIDELKRDLHHIVKGEVARQKFASGEYTAAAMAHQVTDGRNADALMAEVEVLVARKCREMASELVGNVASALQFALQAENVLRRPDAEALLDKVTVSLMTEVELQVTRKCRENASELLSNIPGALRIALQTENVMRLSDAVGLFDKMAVLCQRMQSLEARSHVPAPADVAELTARVSALERNAEAKRASLRNRLDKLSDRLDHDVRDLNMRMKEIEEITMAGPSDDDSEGFNWPHDGGADQMEVWRASLKPGVPVHVHGLQSRPDLNESAGFLKEWFPDRQRWAVEVGGETLLLKPESVVP